MSQGFFSANYLQNVNFKSMASEKQKRDLSPEYNAYDRVCLIWDFMA